MLRGLLLVAVCFAACTAFPGPGFPKKAPRVTLNLDAPPQERWQPIMLNLLNEHGFNYTLAPLVRYWDKLLPESVQPFVEFLSANLEKYLAKEYIEEIKGIAEVIKQHGYEKEMPLGRLCTLNLLYTLSAGCTSIIAEDANNNVWHARNMDWNFDGASLANLTMWVDFQRSNKTVFSTLGWAGYVGALTGIRPGSNGFSVTVDERDAGPIYDILENMVQLVDKDATPPAILIRDAMEKGDSYEAAFQILSTGRVSAPVYYIVGGTGANQGAVMARNWNETDHGPWVIPNGPEPWYVLETNYDHWNQPPAHDNRRAVGEEAMHKMGQAGVNHDGMFQILQTRGNKTTRGVFNDITVYSVVMSAGSGVMDGWIWQ